MTRVTCDEKKGEAGAIDIDRRSRVTCGVMSV
jgi:hypothetical protein